MEGEVEEEEEQSIFSTGSEPPENQKVKVWVTVDGFGIIEEPACVYCKLDDGGTNVDPNTVVVQRYTFRNRNQMTVQVRRDGAFYMNIKYNK